MDVVPACPVITVGGTNGKGSTCAMLEAILRAGGYRTGLYTSPHLVRYNERVRIAGVEASDAYRGWRNGGAPDIAAIERADPEKYKRLIEPELRRPPPLPPVARG